MSAHNVKSEDAPVYLTSQWQLVEADKKQRDKEDRVINQAREIILSRFTRYDVDALVDPKSTREYLRTLIGASEHEIFGVLMLDNRNRVIEWREMFRGTVDGASVYPREVVKQALYDNAAAVILAHNHPSGVTEPSQADIRITERLKKALALVDVRVLDHVIIGAGTTSLAEGGLI